MPQLHLFVPKDTAYFLPFSLFLWAWISTLFLTSHSLPNLHVLAPLSSEATGLTWSLPQQTYPAVLCLYFLVADKCLGLIFNSAPSNLPWDLAALHYIVESALSHFI